MQGWGCVLERHVSISWLGGRVRNTHLIWCVVMVGTVLRAQRMLLASIISSRFRDGEGLQVGLFWPDRGC
jgi:hypothetical protein